MVLLFSEVLQLLLFRLLLLCMVVVVFVVGAVFCFDCIPSFPPVLVLVGYIAIFVFYAILVIKNYNQQFKAQMRLTFGCDRSSFFTSSLSARQKFTVHWFIPSSTCAPCSTLRCSTSEKFPCSHIHAT